MAFFSKITGGGLGPSFWSPVETEDDLQKAIDESAERKVVLFKHSPRCVISKAVLQNFEKEVRQSSATDSYGFWFVDVIAQRSLSREIADRFSVAHQSPQVIVLQDGKEVYNASHSSIDYHRVEKA